MKKISKVLVFILVLTCLVACRKSTGTASNSEVVSTAEKSTTVTQKTVEPKELEYHVDYLSNSVYAGALNTSYGSSATGSINYNGYKGKEGKDYTDSSYYTFNDYTSVLSDMCWSTHNWRTNGDQAILDYITSGFYSFVPNENLDGWAVSLEMAKALPEDVTYSYVGQFGIKAGDKAKAWKISLREDLCWENGEPITADDFIYSYQELLNPLMKNRRADATYLGTFQIYNAKDYYYSGQVENIENAIANTYYKKADLVKNANGQYETTDGDLVYLAINFVLESKLQGVKLKDYVDAFGPQYFDLTNWDTLEKMMDADGLVPLTDETYRLFASVTTAKAEWNETEADIPDYFVVKHQYPIIDWSTVGILKTGEYEITFITAKEVAEPEYYVPYNLSSSFLVYKKYWEAGKKYYNAEGKQVKANSEDIVRIETTAYTDVNSTMSYGPYKLTSFEVNKQYTLERNKNWYGYNDGNHLGQYQTDEIFVKAIDNHESALYAFLKGKVDIVSLQATEMEIYGNSQYILYEPQSFTTKISFNTDVNRTTSRGSQIITNVNFRKAFAQAINVEEFASTLTTGTAGYGLLNTLYVYDPYSGATYRSTDGAKKALVELNGLTYGEGGQYKDLNSAYAAISGYDIIAARQTMAKAYDECIASGLYDGESEVIIKLHVYKSEDIYVRQFNFLSESLNQACVGTGFEGKVSLSMVSDENYLDTMYSGDADLIFSTWGGAAYSPYSSLYECYCTAADGSSSQMEYGFDTSKVLVTITVDGDDFTADLQTWAKWADADAEAVIGSRDGKILLPFNSYSAETKAEFFGKLEYAYLAFYTTKPLYYRGVASLISQKGQYASEQYLDIVGFGGLQFYTYNYDDIQWKAICSSLEY